MESDQSTFKGTGMNFASQQGECQKRVAIFSWHIYLPTVLLHVCKKILVIYGPSKSVIEKNEKSQMGKQDSV